MQALSKQVSALEASAAQAASMLKSGDQKSKQMLVVNLERIRQLEGDGTHLSSAHANQKSMMRFPNI